MFIWKYRMVLLKIDTAVTSLLEETFLCQETTLYWHSTRIGGSLKREDLKYSSLQKFLVSLKSFSLKSQYGFIISTALIFSCPYCTYSCLTLNPFRKLNESFSGLVCFEFGDIYLRFTRKSLQVETAFSLVFNSWTYTHINVPRWNFYFYARTLPRYLQLVI